jgi:hypothetical protein
MFFDTDPEIRKYFLKNTRQKNGLTEDYFASLVPNLNFSEAMAFHRKSPENQSVHSNLMIAPQTQIMRSARVIRAQPRTPVGRRFRSASKQMVN